MRPTNPDPERGRLITLVGIDGAGKTTLATSLHRHLTGTGRRALLVNKHTVTGPDDPQVRRYLDAVNAVVYRDRPANGQVCGDTYWLLALAAWYALQDALVVRPALDDGIHVLLDNSPHKIIARYRSHPCIATELVENVFADLPAPDVVLHLRITPARALDRKGSFTELETGRTGTAGQDFVSYQQGVADDLDAQSQAPHW
ncbi:MAG TPA: hypothetical protein VI248_20570, partial [Kineosporiaceae bacterium]